MPRSILRQLGFGALFLPVLGTAFMNGCGDPTNTETTTAPSSSSSSSSSASGGGGAQGGGGGEGGGGAQGGGGDEGGAGQGGQGGSGLCHDGDTKACYGGDPATQGVGTCAAGTQVCQGGMFGACIGEVTPAPEACDGLDNNCDSAVDEGDPDGGAACLTGLQGACETGTEVCVGGALACASNTTPQPETCGDTVDNDCNGIVDDGCSACGDSVIGAGEQCDDGNTESGDGCSGACQTEAVACAHDKCVIGEALEASCDPCVSQICAEDPFCCSDSWDGLCGSQVQSVCGLMCGRAGRVCGNGAVEAGEQCDDGNADGGDGCSSTCQAEVAACAHDKCVIGEALDASCDPCASKICAEDPFCCSTTWDDLCVGRVQSVCSLTCTPAGPTCGDGVIQTGEQCDDGNTTESDGCSSTCQIEAAACAHDKCATGAALDASCDPCVQQICAVYPLCCSMGWDGQCISGVQSICGLQCGSVGSVCGDGVIQAGEQCDDGNTIAGDGCSSTCQAEGVACVHDKCATGSPLNPSCDPCVSQICADDLFCCGAAWDGQCVSHVQSICGLTCP